MGLDINGTKFLLYARARGVSFERIAMIGRQELLADRSELERNLQLFDMVASTDRIAGMFREKPPYSEGFLEELGAKEIVSIDASAYEGATVMHDMNEPIPEELKDRFSVVLDGGTLEHIFDFPRAIRNCMEMVADGGHFLSITPTNNHAGHGFYQFSPELFFRVFSEENGFELESLMTFEETPDSTWYEVVDPMDVRERVGLVNEYPTMLLVIARKITNADIFRVPPQQSDYSALWEGGGTEPSQASNIARFNAMKIPAAVLRRIKLRLDRKFGMLNMRRRHFKKVDLP